MSEYASRVDWWASEPGLGRVANGVADRVERIRAIGNGQVPTCAVTAFKLLYYRLTGETEPPKGLHTLHLFAGAGGGIIADMMMGHVPVGAVEIDPFCRKVLKQRQDDGWLPSFPIYEDVLKFDGTEISERVDVVCGGFPCQDISCAGGGGVLVAKDQVYSTNSPGYVASYDRATSSWKIHHSLLPEDSIEFLGNFPKSGSMRNGVACQRPPLELGIKGSVGGVYAPTFPTAKVHGLRGGAHTDKTLLSLREKGDITEEERQAMGGRPDFPEQDPNDLSESYGNCERKEYPLFEGLE